LSNRLYEGRLDRIKNGAIFGWAWKEETPDEPVSLDLYVDDKHKNSTVAATYRADLDLAGKGNGRHGFQIRVPDQDRDGKSHLFKVYYHETTIALYGSPRLIVVEAATDRETFSNRART